METIKSYNFSTIKLSDLKSIVEIRRGNEEAHEHKFEEWFEYPYRLKASDSVFLKGMISKFKRRLPVFLEETLKMKFIANILNRVDFMTENSQDWYDVSISGFVNGVELKGFVDMVVSRGVDEPETPYFFMQEFKPSKPDNDPEVQLLAEMLVALEKNKKTVLRGGYIIGRNWYFVILEKIGENKFEYFVSKQFDSLELDHLKQIYSILQAIKLKYCVD